MRGRLRDESPLLPRLESGLARAGLLGDPSRLYELGKVLREAGLTAEPSSGREWKSGVNFQSCPTTEEFVELQRKEPEWKHVVLVDGDRHLHYHTWQVPPIGLVVARRLERDPRYAIVSGAYCDKLVRRSVHSDACSTCSCFTLTWGTGFWKCDQLWVDADGSVRTIYGSGMEHEPDDLGAMGGHWDGVSLDEAPHWFRPAPEFEERIPISVVRPSIREAFQARLRASREAKVRAGVAAEFSRELGRRT